MHSLHKGSREADGIGICKLVVDDDYVHVDVNVPPTMSVSDAFGKLKGLSAFLLFKAFPNFRKRYSKGSFWSIGKIYRSISDVQQDVVENYIRKHRSYKQTSLTGYSGL